jgi:hypothetical protein
MRIISLEKKPVVNTELVAALEGLLERAKSGNMTSLVACYEMNNGDMAMEWSVNSDRLRMAGLLLKTAHDISELAGG